MWKRSILIVLAWLVLVLVALPVGFVSLKLVTIGMSQGEIRPWLLYSRGVDRLGPIPRFSWIAPGEPRPAPAVAAVVVGENGEPHCGKTAEPDACLRRNFRSFLNQHGEDELKGSPGERIYRFLDLPACSASTSIRFTLRSDGTGDIAVARLAPSNEGPRPTLQVQTVRLTPRKAAALERKLRGEKANWITPDARALVLRRTGYDGVSSVYEAVIDGRYRYAYRDSGDWDAAYLERLGERFRRAVPGLEPSRSDC